MSRACPRSYPWANLVGVAGLHCSFCGKTQAQVEKLIAGPEVYICDQCVDLCQEILDEELRDAEVPGRGQLSADERPVEIVAGEPLSHALQKLSYRERRVLELRYGLSGESPRTLNEVGRTFKLTRREIRQIEYQAQQKLQSLFSED